MARKPEIPRWKHRLRADLGMQATSKRNKHLGRRAAPSLSSIKSLEHADDQREEMTEKEKHVMYIE